MVRPFVAPSAPLVGFPELLASGSAECRCVVRTQRGAKERENQRIDWVKLRGIEIHGHFFSQIFVVPSIDKRCSIDR